MRLGFKLDISANKIKPKRKQIRIFVEYVEI